MNIVWITSGYPWEGRPYGGIFFQSQAQALARQGVRIAIMAGVSWIPGPLAALSSRHALIRSAPRHQRDENVEVFRVPYLGHRFQKHLGWPHVGLARRILNHLPFRPDVVHGHFAYPMGLAACRIGERLGVPSVITLHGSDTNVTATANALGARRFRRALTGADRVLGVSQALCERAMELSGVRPECLPLGINLGRFRSGLDRAQARAALDLPLDRKVVLFIGNLMADKGILLALEALRDPRLKDALGVFVGTGPLAQEIAKRDNGLCRGSVPNAVVAQYLQAADLVILPSYAEGLPTVLVEAGASGTPVVASSVGGIPELIGDGRGTLIPPDDAAALRDAILDTLERPQEAQERALRLQAHVRDRFDVDKNARTLMHLYEDLMARPPRRP